MKNSLVKLTAIIMMCCLFAACKPKPKEQPKEEVKNAKTLENLQAAFKGETTASAKYLEFAKKAKEEGYTEIAILFEAASKSEDIHARNHKAVILKLGESVPEIKPEFEVKTTKENLESAIHGEGYEVDSMYPGFIQIAKDENVADAIKSFTWAIDTEKKHRTFYTTALEAISSKKVKELPKFYAVCPKCGNTFNESALSANCDFCMTAKEKYILFK